GGRSAHAFGLHLGHGARQADRHRAQHQHQAGSDLSPVRRCGEHDRQQSGDILMASRKLMMAKVALAGLVALGLSAPATARRDAAYHAARAAGQLGEKADGYLGYVTPPSAAVRAVVEDLNIKRRALYSEKARAAGATVEEYA